MEQEATEITESLCIALFSLFEGIYVHPLFLKASGLTHDVIGSAIEVYKDKGPGLWESIYEWCLTMELGLRGYATKGQDNVTVNDKRFRREYPLRCDLLVEACLIVEVKASESYFRFTRRNA